MNEGFSAFLGQGNASSQYMVLESLEYLGRDIVGGFDFCVVFGAAGLGLSNEGFRFLRRVVLGGEGYS